MPKSVRLKVGARYEEEDGRRGGKECYFDLIDYRSIATSNWQLFEPLIAYGTGNKEKRTAWMAFVNEQRKIVAHPSSAASVSLEDLNELQAYAEWLAGKREVNGSVTILDGSLEVMPAPET